MEMLDFQKKRWVIKHKRTDESIDQSTLDFLKWYHRSDMILKKDGILFFIEEIIDAHFEEISE